MEDEFEFERGEILSNIVLLEDHAQKFACPFCMEKHASKIIGYAEEIALGSKNSEDKMLEKLAEDAREWRRQIQGLKEEGHAHKHIEGNPRTRAFLPHGLTECEKEHPSVQKKLSSCIKQAEISCCGEHTKDYSKCSCNPIAVCRASVSCP